MRFKIIILTVIIVITIDSFCQRPEKLSAEVDMNFFHYLISQNRKNYFNYGYSILFSYSNDNFKVSSGINYSTKNSYYYGDPSSFDQLIRRDYRLSYLNIPLLITYGHEPSRKFNVQFVGGIIFNNILDYDIVSYHTYGGPVYENDVDADQKTGISLRMGMNVSHAFNQRLILNLSPFIDFKFVLDHYDNYRPNYKNLTDDRFLLGVKLGIEYVICKFHHNE